MKQISSSTTEVDLGTYVTDLAIQPYIKPRDITFVASSLKPNARFYAFFDGVSVDEYVVIPNKLQVTSGVHSNTIFVSGEIALIANNGSDLAFNIASYLAGGTNYDMVIVSNSERGSSNVSVINETGKPLSSKVIYGLESKSTYAIASVLDHRSGLTRGVGPNTITLASDAPSVNIAGNTLTLVHETGSYEGHGREFTVVAYNTSTKVATVTETTTTAEQAATSWTYSIGYNSANKLALSFTYHINHSAVSRLALRVRLGVHHLSSYLIHLIQFSQQPCRLQVLIMPCVLLQQHCQLFSPIHASA